MHHDSHRSAACLLSATAAMLSSFGLCSAAQAQATGSATVYGLMDSYLEYRTHNSASGKAGKVLNSGGMNTSRWGLRGTEDLGTGLKVVFQLESEIALDTGNAGSAFWGRQANVGLDGRFGRVVMGRSYSTTYDFILPFDPMGYAPVYSWATSAGATGGRKDGMVTGVSNLVKYRGEVGGLRVGATYGFGESEGPVSDRATAVLAASYTWGGLSGVITAEQINGTTVATGRDQTRTYHVGGSYDFGKVKLYGVLRRYDKAFGIGGADNTSRTAWAGVSYQATPALTLAAAYYRQGIRSSNTPAGVGGPSLVSLRARYGLSKRTDLYAMLGFADAKAGVVGLSRDDVAFGSSQTGVAAGIQHRF